MVIQHSPHGSMPDDHTVGCRGATRGHSVIAIDTRPWPNNNMNAARKLPGSKTLEETALMLTLRKSKTDAGRAIQAVVLARVEADIARRNAILAMVRESLAENV